MLGGEAIEHDNFPASLAISGYCAASSIRLTVVVYGARPQIDAPIWPLRHLNRFTTKTRAGDGRQSTGAGETGHAVLLQRYRPSVDGVEQYAVAGRTLMSSSGNFTICAAAGRDDGVDYCRA